MFDKLYFKNKYVFIEEGQHYMVDFVNSINDPAALIYKVAPEDSNNYAIYERLIEYKPIYKDEIMPLSEFLISKNVELEKFRNPIGRTNKIVHELERINEVERTIVEGKKKIKK